MLGNLNGRMVNGAAILFVALLAAMLVLGIVLADDYGISWDELTERIYAEDALGAYQSGGEDWENYEFRRYYGPSYLIIWSSLSNWLGASLDRWDSASAGHFINYLSFVFAITAFFLLGLQYFSPHISLFSTALLATHPLLFGHAFINHKDLPFMALFLGTVAFGLMAVDRGQTVLEPPGAYRLVEDTSKLSGRGLALLACLTLVVAALLVDLSLNEQFLFAPFQRVIEAAYAGESLPFLNEAFAMVAQNAQQVPLADYIARAAIWFGWLRLFLLGAALVVLAMILWRASPSIRRVFHGHLSFSRVHFGGSGLTLLALSALCAGLASSSRILGPLAAALVVFALLAEKRWGGLLWSGLYLLSIGLITILAWPYLWASPIGNFLASLDFFANHPWQGTVLYAGEIFDGSQMPWHYLPHLLTIQLTEPALILAVAGLAILLVDLVKKRPGSVRFWILLLWIFIPLLAAIVRPTKIFDNFRQFLFIVPPLILLSGLGMRYVVGESRKQAAILSLFGLTLLPGILAIVRLHPYEYIYYNANLNGLPGVIASYELDYWCTTIRPAMQFVNDNAKQGQTIAVVGPEHSARYYVRPDLVLTRQRSSEAEAVADWMVICSRSDWLQQFQPNGDLVWQVERLGVPLGSVWQLGPEID